MWMGGTTDGIRDRGFVRNEEKKKKRGQEEQKGREKDEQEAMGDACDSEQW